MYIGRMQSPAGTLLLGATERGLCTLLFVEGRHPIRLEGTDNPELLAPYVHQLTEYFAATRKTFDLPLDMRGTEFQLRCWNALRTIPYGETRTYAELSRMVGCRNGFRAVGAANGANPVSIIVPCHRVIASDGTLGGYGGGLATKELLLRLEGAWPPKHHTAGLFS